MARIVHRMAVTRRHVPATFAPERRKQPQKTWGAT